MEYEIITSS